MMRLCDIISVTILLLASLQSAFAGDPCPAKNELAPCTCTHVGVTTTLAKELFQLTSPLPSTPSRLRRSLNVSILENELELSSRHGENGKNNASFYTVVHCKVPKSRAILEEAISVGLHRKSVDRLVLTNVPPEKEHTLVNLPEGWLRYLRVKQFEIRDTVLSGDFIHMGNPFLGQEQSIVSFAATNCYLYGSLTYDIAGTVNTKGLNTLSRIELVDLSRNHLVHVTNMAFRYPSANLTTINLSQNSIKTIEGSTFTYAPKLKAVNLSHNLIEVIARSFFASPARTLESIDFSWNHIKVVPVDMFNNMPALKVVNLSHNFLYSLSTRPWSTIWRQLKFIDLRGNFLECNCDIMWLLDILSPPKINVTTTLAPTPLVGQTLLGSCDFTEPQMYAKTHQLVRLTRGNINCGAP